MFFLKRGDDAGGDVGNLRIGQRGFAALQLDFDQQGIFAGRNIFAAEEIGGFDGSNFGNIESRDGSGDVGKAACRRKAAARNRARRRESAEWAGSGANF